MSPKALAHALLYLRHPSFDRAVARLVDDDNSWVKGAARQTLSRRRDIAKAELAGEEQGDPVQQWLAELEARHGARARTAAAPCG